MPAFSAAGRRRAGVTVLCGKAGVGRTRLARQAAHAPESGWAVVTARAVGPAPRMAPGPIVEAMTHIARSGEPTVRAAAAESGKHRSALASTVPVWAQAADQDAEVTQT